MRRASLGRSVVGIGVAAIWAVALSAVAGAQPDPLVGTWKLDVAKSTYKPGPAPKSATVVIEAAGKGIKVAVDAVTADGPMKWGYSSAGDGKDTPVTGNPMYDAAAVTRTNPTESTIVYKKAGKTITTVKASVSKDGKTMTTTTDGTDAKGQAMHNVAQYVKQ
jgi:hypothetical protein